MGRLGHASCACTVPDTDAMASASANPATCFIAFSILLREAELLREAKKRSNFLAATPSRHSASWQWLPAGPFAHVAGKLTSAGSRDRMSNLTQVDGAAASSLSPRRLSNPSGVGRRPRKAV